MRHQSYKRLPARRAKYDQVWQTEISSSSYENEVSKRLKDSCVHCLAPLVLGSCAFCGE